MQKYNYETITFEYGSILPDGAELTLNNIDTLVSLALNTHLKDGKTEVFQFLLSGQGVLIVFRTPE